MKTGAKAFHHLFEAYTEGEPLKTEALISELNAALEESRLHQITSKTHLFWLLFCKFLHKCKLKELLTFL